MRTGGGYYNVNSQQTLVKHHIEEKHLSVLFKHHSYSSSHKYTTNGKGVYTGSMPMAYKSTCYLNEEVVLPQINPRVKCGRQVLGGDIVDQLALAIPEEDASPKQQNKPGTTETACTPKEFVDEPSKDFFCPVTFELLVEPRLTSCCGHHLSQEATARLEIERKSCPMCNEAKWSSMLDKSFKRRVHELRIHCPHKSSGCGWVGEMNDEKRHVDSCEKRPWTCQYCRLKCTHGEGEDKHWPTCPKFPVLCPNGCEVGSVERCSEEEHRSVCSLEPVACEMKEFVCSAVVPRKSWPGT